MRRVDYFPITAHPSESFIITVFGIFLFFTLSKAIHKISQSSESRKEGMR